MTQRVPPPLPEASSLDLSFRPPSYWPDDDLRLALLSNIKGEARRRLIRESLESDTLDVPPEGILRPELEPDLREFLGRIHPMNMGGEYLPSYLAGEVEIARVARKSVTADMIAVRARMEEDGLIHCVFPASVRESVG